MTTRFDPLVTRSSEPKIDWPDTIPVPVTAAPERDGLETLEIEVTPLEVPEGVTPER